VQKARTKSNKEKLLAVYHENDLILIAHLNQLNSQLAIDGQI